MKISAQILLLLALLSLSSLSFSQKVTVTKSFSTSKTFHSSSPGNGDSGESGSGGSNNESGEETGEEASGEETETPPPLSPGGDSFNACDPSNRPEACTFEYLPVCGYIHECEGGACTTTFGNDCVACSTANVDGYVDGACEDTRTVCEPGNRPEACPLIFTATCAVAARCEGSHCSEDTSNSCVACSMRGVAYSLPGACPANDNGERNSCDASNRPDICTADYTPVCAHLNNCVGSFCWSTAGNACSACANENIDFWYAGECSDDEDEGDGDGRAVCDADNRPEICTADYTPVCAHISGCTGNDCWFTAGNACSACGNATVDYHIPGECAAGDDRTYCDPNDRPEVCTLDYNPVCAHTSGCTGDDCWTTAGNACGACGDATVDYHIPGECATEDDRTYCDPNDRPEVCTADYTPVCAHTSGCTGDDCWNTAGNACGACGDATVDYHVPGECPNDETGGS